GRPLGSNTATYAYLRLPMILATGIVLGGLAPVLHLVSTPTQYAVFWVFMLLPVLWTPQTVYTSLWVARGDSIRAQYPQLIETVVRTTGIVLVALVIPMIEGPGFLDQILVSPSFSAKVASDVLLGLTGAYVAGAAAATAYCVPSVARQIGRFDRAQAGQYFLFAWPLMGSLLLQFLAGNSIPFIITATLTPAAASLTWFLAANGFRLLLMGVPNAIVLPLFPNLAGLHARGDLEAVRARTWAALRYTALLVLPGAVALTVYRANFLNVLFNQSIAIHASFPLAILAVSAVPASLTLVIQVALNAIGQQRLELYLTSTQVGSLYVGALVLMPVSATFLGYPVGGLDGAAYAVLVSSAAALGLNTYFLWSRLQIVLRLRPILLIAFASIVTFVAVGQLNHFVNPNRWYLLLVLVVFGYVVYSLFLAVVGELTRRDVRILAGALQLPARLIEALARFCWRES
ncbi:MAG TPA: polysaccharide biosynthesis C-terminal domain-containing protein, partial [Thermoplasmata archaeon]|nr:polysaccharide biosynthesis C-terminal domain-containing protein [Thermoplasmata archaeon]